jgi:transketolase
VDTKAIQTLSINTIRTLSMDAVQKANSGHPGTPMAMAPVAYTLFQRFLRYDPQHPVWPNRDRFVLSIGHASMLLYSILHLAGVKQLDENGEPTAELAVPLDEIRRFRQLGSKTPGHPEYHLTSGIETTTGPLGQGVANSVGMAIAGKWLASYFNRPDFELFDFDVYALTGDGCMMEGVSSEAASLAGHLKLSNLCWIYDSNRITIEGKTDLAFTEDVAARFKAYGWNVTQVEDVNDLEELESALNIFKNENQRPTFIVAHSHIGYGAPNKQDTHGAHGEPLGADEITLTKKYYSWLSEEDFFVPDGVREDFAEGLGKRGAQLRSAWEAKFEEYKKQYPELAEQFLTMENREAPEGWDADLPEFPADAKGMAGREASGKVLNAIAQKVPWLIGGSADLAPSTKTLLTFEGTGHFQANNYAGRNFHFGVREHAMGSIINGMSLTKVRAYGAGFLIFSDYARPALRLSAVMEIPAIHVFTHDSIGVGEDGPTHQPIEQIMSLRMIPGYWIIRPADANEVVEAWRVIMKLKHEPVALALTRQALPTLDRTKYAAASGLAKGAYVLADAEDGKPEVLLIASGSEVYLCVEAYEQLTAAGIKARVVSFPCWELFEKQSQEYKDSVLPPEVNARVSVEQGVTLGWERYVGRNGAKIGMTTFGASAPFKDLQKHFGFTAENIVKAAKQQVGK